MRLDKYISSHSALSRSEAHRAIRGERVTVDGALQTNSALKVDPAQSIIHLDDARIYARLEPVYLMLHKPAGFVSATSDSIHPTVLDLAANATRYKGDDFDQIFSSTLQIVGRLDRDTTGLLLLTDDGQWNHRICSPKSMCTKTYIAELSEDVDNSLVERFANGITLHSEEKDTLPAKLEILTPKRVRVEISEGRYHQVKRMFAACGNHVCALHREKIGALSLDVSLPAGYFRRLSRQESSLF